MLKKISNVAVLSAIGLSLIASPVSATPSTSSWGYFGEGVLVFPDATGTVNGTFGWENTGPVSFYSANDDDEYFVASTPIGQVFGQSPNIGGLDPDHVKVTTLDDTTTDAIFTIDFDSEVGANRLGIVVSDIDSDYVTITLQDGSGHDLTAAEIQGSATTKAFNYCTYSPVVASCASDTDVPVITTGATSVTATGSATNTQGSSFWIQPSAAVQHVTIAIRNTDDGAPSSERIHIAQLNYNPVVEDNSPQLAETGSGSNALILAASLGLLVAGAASRVIARKKH